MTARDFPEYLSLRWQQQSLFLAAECSFYSTTVLRSCIGYKVEACGERRRTSQG